jgi:hypothetical protein
MAGPPDHRGTPAPTWRPRDPALGDSPRDGDFARLLEAASAPRAHRMRVDPEIEAFGPTRPRRRAPYGPPGMNWGRVPTPGASMPPGADEPGADSAARLPGASPDAGGFGAGAPRPARADARPRPGRALRDRVVAVLFAIAGLWILMNVLDAATHSGGGDLGVLLVLAVVAFFVLRAWLRPRRPSDSPR